VGGGGNRGCGAIIFCTNVFLPPKPVLDIELLPYMPYCVAVGRRKQLFDLLPWNRWSNNVEKSEILKSYFLSFEDSQPRAAQA